MRLTLVNGDHFFFRLGPALPNELVQGALKLFNLAPVQMPRVSFRANGHRPLAICQPRYVPVPIAAHPGLFSQLRCPLCSLDDPLVRVARSVLAPPAFSTWYSLPRANRVARTVPWVLSYFRGSLDFSRLTRRSFRAVRANGVEWRVNTLI